MKEYPVLIASISKRYLNISAMCASSVFAREILDTCQIVQNPLSVSLWLPSAINTISHTTRLSKTLPVRSRLILFLVIFNSPLATPHKRDRVKEYGESQVWCAHLCGAHLGHWTKRWEVQGSELKTSQRPPWAKWDFLTHQNKMLRINSFNRKCSRRLQNLMLIFFATKYKVVSSYLQNKNLSELLGLHCRIIIC